MKWEHRRFKTYGELVAFLNRISGGDWKLHSWQDVKSGNYGNTDIRAIFVNLKTVQDKLPEV